MKAEFGRLLHRAAAASFASWRSSGVAYIVIFVIVFLFSTSALWMRGKGFIWIDDGLEQQYTFFLMEGEWLRELFSNIFVNHSFVLPMWTNEVGYGADYFISVMNTLGNPINLLSAFADVYSADFILNATVPLTLCLAGASFLIYCSYKEFDKVYSVIGAIVYVFSAYSLLIFTQIYMLYPLVLGPLVLLGVDKIFDGKAPWMYILSMFAVVVAGVYQAYTFCILVAIYCIVKFIYRGERRSLKTFIRLFVLFFASTLLAIGMGAVFFVPVADSILSQDRLSLERSSNLLYSAVYYVNLLTGTITAQSVGSECFYGIASTALISIVALFKRGANSEVKIARTMFVVFFIMLCIPFIGKIMNGMAYPSNRWIWAASMLGGLSVPMGYPLLANESIRKQVAIKICVIAAAFLILLAPMLGSHALFYESLAVCLLVCVSLFLFDGRALKGLICCAVALNVFFLYYQWGTSVSSTHVDLGASYETIKNQEPGVEGLIRSVNDTDEWRYENSNPGRRNSNLAFGVLGTSFYNSLYNGAIDEMHSTIGLTSSPFNFSFNGLSDEASLESIAGVKYYICKEGESDNRPVLFTKLISAVVEDGETYQLWASDSLLPIAFELDNPISREEYDELNMAQRQFSLISNGVIESDAVADGGTLKSGVSCVDYRVADSNGVSFKEDGTMEVNGPDAYLDIAADIPDGCENYLSISGLGVGSCPSGEGGSGLGLKKTVLNFLSGVSTSGKRDLSFTVTSGDWTKNLWSPTDQHDLYGGKSSWAIKLPYEIKGQSAVIRIAFPAEGCYRLGSISLDSISEKAILESISQLSNCSVSDQRMSTNSFECFSSGANDRMVMFRIPYGKGWRAYIDGEPVDIERADIGFMAISVPAGDHSVQLEYCTPGIFAGLAISIVSWAIFASLISVTAMRKKRAKVGRIL